MTEWEVVGVIIALIGLFVTVYKLVTPTLEALTKLGVITERMDKRLESHIHDSKGEHNALWDRVDDHEIRIVHLEHEQKEGE